MRQWLVRPRTPLAIVFVLSSALIAFANGPARADLPVQQGWWTVTNPGSGLAGAPAPPYSPPPDVPSDGLLVQGGAADPSAYAAVVYRFPPAGIAGDLTLRVTSGSATTSGSTLQVCPLETHNIEPAQGGPIADGPGYDCSEPTTAMPEDGVYQFSVSSLASGGTLAVAILPTSAADRVVFDQPDADSLAVRAPRAGTTRRTVPGPETTAASPRTVAVPAVPSQPVAAPTYGAAAPVGANAPERSAVGTDLVPDGLQLPGSASRDADANPAAVVAVLVGVLLASGLWIFAGRAAVRGAILAEAEVHPDGLDST